MNANVKITVECDIDTMKDVMIIDRFSYDGLVEMNSKLRVENDKLYQDNQEKSDADKRLEYANSNIDSLESRLQTAYRDIQVLNQALETAMNRNSDSSQKSEKTRFTAFKLLQRVQTLCATEETNNYWANIGIAELTKAATGLLINEVRAARTDDIRHYDDIEDDLLP